LSAAHALLSRAKKAEVEGLKAIEEALSLHLLWASAERYVIEDAAPADLFACLADLPIGGLEGAARECAREVGPRVGKTFLGKVARDRQTGAVVGHVYYSSLADSRYPIAAEGDPLFLFCPWVHAPLRGRGIGRRLFAALREEAQKRGAGGILTEASTLPIFLGEEHYLREGFRELARAGEMRLYYYPLSTSHPVARFVEPEGRREGVLSVSHSYNCPFLLFTRQKTAETARAFRMPVEERDAESGEAGIFYGKERLPNLPFAPDVLLSALRAAPKGSGQS
jgi:GNAT superfamily N-acetyltransferase